MGAIIGVVTDLDDIDVDIRARGRPGDLELGVLAGRQYGVVAHRQLVAIGLGRSAIQRRVSAGRLHRLHTGVYAVGHRSLTQRGTWMAAVLAGGPGALLGQRCAAAAWSLRRGAPTRVDVVVPGRSRRGMPGIALHLPRSIHPEDRAVIEGIPVTSVARTLVDLAEVLQPAELERAFEEAERLRLLDLGAIEEVMGRSHGRRGLRPLRALVAELQPAPETRSELERRFVSLCRDAGLPPPALNAGVCGFYVDAVWHDRRLVVELDSREYHLNRAAFERDRDRDAVLQVAGYRVLRLTHRRLVREPRQVAETVRALLGEPPAFAGLPAPAR